MTGAAAPAVVDYTSTALADIFSRGSHRGADEPSGIGAELLRARDHLGFLEGVLGQFGCRTMVVEHEYVDRDFLEDFAAYHVHSFRAYGRHCTRVHFFSAAFSRDDLVALISDTAPQGLTLDALNGSYLGYCVIKPLPSTVVGRTALRVYPDEPPDQRLYPTAIDEQVHLFGLTLSLRTLPFQEQDRDVAACATSALWSVFQATGKRFQHAIPSPVQITKAASSRSGHEDRVLPNGNGLTGRQMADAIRAVGLEPYLAWLSDRSKPSRVEAEAASGPADRMIMLQVALAAYLRAGIPCLLLASMVDRGCGEEQVIGSHVVAVAGYRATMAKAKPYSATGTIFSATRMGKLYAHDDQVGPFARMEFGSDDRLLTAQKSDRGDRWQIVAKPTTIMIPLVPLVRIPFQQLVQIALKLDVLVEAVRGAVGAEVGLERRMEWDIQLSSLAAFRDEMHSAPIAPEERLELMLARFPEWLWRLRAMDGPRPLFELLFDPTDLLQGRLFLRMVPIDHQASDFFAGAVGNLEAGAWDRLPLEAIRLAMTEHMARKGASVPAKAQPEPAA